MVFKPNELIFLLILTLNPLKDIERGKLIEGNRVIRYMLHDYAKVFNC